MAARRWLKAVRGAGATTVLFDAPDRVNPRRLVHGSDSPDGVLTPDQIEALRDYSELLGVKILWSEASPRRRLSIWPDDACFSISTSSATKIASQPSSNRTHGWQPKTGPDQSVRRMHAIIQGGLFPANPRVARWPCPRAGNVHHELSCEGRRGCKVSGCAGDIE